MDTTATRLRSGLRVVWALAAKDMVDALRNKTILFNVLTVFLLMMVYQWLFLPMMHPDTELVVYDAGNSRLVAALEDSPQFILHRAASVQELKEEMSTELERGLGLTIPPDFDSRLALAGSDAGGEAVLSGYIMWSSRSSAADVKADYERELTELVGQPVRIDIEGSVYPHPDSMGPIRLVSIILVITVIFMGALTVPHLMFEEKRTRTLDALLVSPASIAQVVLGKALAGMFYCLAAIAVAVAFNWAFVTNWGLTILAVLCGTLLAVGFGLVLGTFLERREQMMIWALIPSYFLLGPVFLSVVDPILPEAVKTAFAWIPTVALALLFRYSFSAGAALTEVLLRLGIVGGGVVLVLALVVWKVRRSDR